MPEVDQVWVIVFVFIFLCTEDGAVMDGWGARIFAIVVVAAAVSAGLACCRLAFLLGH